MEKYFPPQINNPPLKEVDVKNLLASGFPVTLLFSYEPSETGGEFFVYVKTGSRVSELQTQRHAHRSFRNLQRGIDWGCRLGASHAFVSVSYEGYCANPSADDPVDEE